MHMHLISSALTTVLLMIKQAVTYTSVALTALVSAGNELQRWRMVYRFIEHRQTALRKAWAVSLGLYFVLAVLCAWLEESTAAFVIDALGILLMIGVVMWLNQRRASREVKAKGEPTTTPVTAARRRGVGTPARRPEREDLDEEPEDRPRRMRRRRRVPRE
jgi:hypothetical protein